MYTSTEVLAWIGIAGGIGFFTGIAVTLSYEDLLDKKRRKTIKKLKARLADHDVHVLPLGRYCGNPRCSDHLPRRGIEPRG